jgi:hypothetical protein
MTIEMTSSETPGTKDLLPKLIVHLGENVLSAKANIRFFGSARKKTTLINFFREACPALRTRGDSAAIELELTGNGHYGKLCAAVSGSIDCESPPNENVCALQASRSGEFCVIIENS